MIFQYYKFYIILQNFYYESYFYEENLKYFFLPLHMHIIKILPYIST